MRKEEHEQMKNALIKVFPWLPHRSQRGENLADVAANLALEYQEQFVSGGFGRGAFLVESGGHLACLEPTATGWRVIDLGNLKYRQNEPLARWQKKPATVHALNLPRGDEIPQ